MVAVVAVPPQQCLAEHTPTTCSHTAMSTPDSKGNTGHIADSSPAAAVPAAAAGAGEAVVEVEVVEVETVVEVVVEEERRDLKQWRWL